MAQHQICAVPSCSSSSHDFGNVLFNVPSDSGQRRRWEEALGATSLSDSDLVCWSHFTPSAFRREAGEDFRLEYGAVPTLLLGRALAEEGNLERVCRLCAGRIESGGDLAKMYTSEDSSMFLNFLLGDLEDSLSRVACGECIGQVKCSLRLIRNCKKASWEFGRTLGTEEVLLKTDLKAEMDVFGEIPIDPVELEEVKMEVESLDSSSDVEDGDGDDSDATYEFPTQQASRRVYKCKFCRFTCEVSSELSNHMKENHKDELESIEPTKKKIQIEDIEGPFECPECPMIFERRRQLGSHMKRHNGKVRKIKPPSEPKELYECEYCDFKCKLRQQLAGHRSSHSEEIRKTKPADKIYDSVCPICGKVLGTRGSFLTHMKIHNNQRDFTCEHCGKQFFKKKLRDMHVESFHLKKVFECKICGIKCKWENSLERHMLRHDANSYKHECTQCDKKFLTAYLLKTHMTKHTGFQVFCEICGAGFRFNFLLTQHKIRDHDIQVEGVKLYKRFQKGMRSTKKKNQQESTEPSQVDAPAAEDQIAMESYQQQMEQMLPTVDGTGQSVSNY